MTRARWGAARAAFIAATGGPNNPIRSMIAAKYSLKHVHDEHREALGACGYQAFVIYARKLLGVRATARKSPNDGRHAADAGRVEHHATPQEDIVAGLRRKTDG